MKVAIIAPSPVPFTRGGAERAVGGLARAVNELTPHECELVKLPVDESTLTGLVDGYESFSVLDLDHFDRVLSMKYPAWIAGHDNHTVLMFHPLRGLYDTYHLFGLPERPSPVAKEFADVLHLVHRRHDRAVLPEFFGRFHDAVRAHGPDHPDLAFPGPLAREIVHWLDLVALAPAQMRRHYALSRTVASRDGYFPPGVTPGVVRLPSDLGPLRHGGQRHLFTVSRLDGPKRFDLLIRAMAHVPGDLPLLIAGTGPEEPRLRALAAGDHRIRFLGFVPDDALVDLYADALAVAFVPDDEDLGLITLESMGCATPVITCLDSGGPTEFVVDGVTGLVAEPSPPALGAALGRLVNDPVLAAELGRAGERRAARVNWPDVVRTLLDQRERPGRAAQRATVDGAGRTAPGGAARAKVVVTTTFPVHPPHGGGQLRCFHLYGALTQHADVEVVALVDPIYPAGSTEVVPGLVQTLVPCSPALYDIGEELSGAAAMPVTDIVAGRHIRSAPNYVDALRRAGTHADVVILAHPYLLPAVEQAGLDTPIIYDAHNVEADLKGAVLPDTGLGRELLDAVVEIEGRAVSRSAALAACSVEDAAALTARYGRDAADITVIPNGTDTAVTVPTPAQRQAARQRWCERFATTGLDTRRPGHLALFLASWHPPNLDAAEVILELAPELPDLLFILAGSQGGAFRDRATPSNVILAGVVAERAKAALLGCVDVALNPMRSGSGTNLKVIEYLAAGVPTVSTPFGVRGLDVVDGEHLLLAPPWAFADAIRATIDDPVAAHRRAAAGRALAVERYDWQPLGARLWTMVRDILKARNTTPGRIGEVV